MVAKISKKKEAFYRNLVLIAALWAEFISLFPTEQACLEELYKRYEAAMFKCRSCKAELERIYTVRCIRCAVCKKLSWLTSETFLKGIRRADAWLAAEWLRERGAVLTSPVFSKVTGVAPSTALNILKTPGFIMISSIEREEESFTVPSAEFKDVFRKRSKDTLRRCHPVSEQAEMEKEYRSADSVLQDDINNEFFDETETEVAANAAQSFDEAAESDERAEVSAVAPDSDQPVDESSAERMVLDLLSAEPVSVDFLFNKTNLKIGVLSATLTLLEITGQATRTFGDRYVRATPIHCKNSPENKKELSVEERSIVVEFIEYIKLYHHGISRKTVQIYFALFWYHRFRKQLPSGWLMDMCLRFKYVEGIDLQRYISPLEIKFFREPILSTT